MGERPISNAAPGRGCGGVTASPRLRLRVLVVDDDADVARLWVLLIEREGFEVVAVDRPEDAIEVALAFRPDLAVLDLHLGDMDGHALGVGLRAVLPEVRLVVVTGDARPSIHERSAALGFDAHLVKPVAPRDLLRVLGVLVLSRTPSGSDN